MIKLENLCYKSDGRLLLDNITIDFYSGDCWALCGANGSGKSLLAMIMGGLLKASSGSVILEGKIGYASFERQHKILSDERRRENSGFMQGAPDEGTRLRTFLTGEITGQKDFNDEFNFLRYTDMFGLGKIADRGIRFLSTGEFRKALLCRALLAKPDILIIDDPYDGLDVVSREHLKQLLDILAGSGERLFLITPRPAEIPEWITHAVFLDNGRLISAGEYSGKETAGSGSNKKSAGGWGRKAADIIYVHEEESASPAKSTNCYDEIVISMKDVSVAYDGRRVISGINWTVTAGERWKITGPNGCGKSTLISLINGDNPKAYSNDITLFGKKRGSGETVWDIKKRIGFVSGDFQMNYRMRTTLLDTVLSGFYDSIGLYIKPTGLQLDEAHWWLEAAGLHDKKGKMLKELSYGERRTALIIRALIKKSELVILDEPCQGLDEENTSSVIEVINMLSSFPDVTILLVTHGSMPDPEGFRRHLSFCPHPEGGYTAMIKETI